MKKLLSVFLLAISTPQLMSANITWAKPPTTISSLGVDSANPHVGIDANGNAVAVWLENGVVKARNKLNAGSWGTTYTLSGMGASVPQLAVDSNGNATAVWLEGGVVKTAYQAFSGSWATAVTLSQSGATSPQVAIDPTNGDIAAVWARSGIIEAAVRQFAGSWPTASAISNAGSSLPQLAFYNGKVVAAWTGTFEGINRVYSAKFFQNSWSSQQAVSAPGVQSVNPFVAFDPTTGNPSAIWFSYGGVSPYFTDVIVQTASESGAFWSQPENLSAPGAKDPSTLMARIAFDGSGNALALWVTSFDGATYFVESSSKKAGMDWMGPVDLVASDVYAYAEGLATIALGNSFAAYMSNNTGTTVSILASETDLTSYLSNYWSPSQVLSKGAANANPDIAASVTSNTINAVAAWVYNNGSNNIIQTVVGTEAKVKPPTSVSILQSSANKGVFTELYNKLSWHVSPSPRINGYVIYRNGELIANVNQNVSSYVDHNRIAGVTDVYEIAAYDNDFSQSSFVTISYP